MPDQTHCDWCGGEGEVLGTEKWLGLTLEAMGCKDCHHEWMGGPTERDDNDRCTQNDLLPHKPSSTA